jgi:hypothetical protein
MVPRDLPPLSVSIMVAWCVSTVVHANSLAVGRDLARSPADCLTAAYTQRLPLEFCR